jgi:hypothetical protein
LHFAFSHLVLFVVNEYGLCKFPSVRPCHPERYCAKDLASRVGPDMSTDRVSCEHGTGRETGELAKPAVFVTFPGSRRDLWAGAKIELDMIKHEQVQAIVSIAFERVPRNLRASFQRSHAGVNVTRVIKETTTLGKVSYEVYFVDALGHDDHVVLHGPRQRRYDMPSNAA